MNIKRQTGLCYLFETLACFRLVDAVWVLFLLGRGYSLAQVGIAEGVFHVTSMLFEVPSGMVADLYGRRRTLLFSGAAGILFSLFMALDGWHGWIYLGMVFSALQCNLLSGTESAMVYDSLLEGGCEKRYKKVWANMSVLGRIARSVSCAMSPVAILLGYQYTYLVMGILSFGLILTAAGMREPQYRKTPEHIQKAGMGEYISETAHRFREHTRSTVVFIRQHPRTMCKLFADAAVACPCYLLMMYLQEHLVNCGWPKEWIGMLILLIPLTGAVGAWFAGRNRSALFKTIMACGILGGAGTILAGSKMLAVTIAGACLAQGCEGFMEITASENTNREFTSEQRATLDSIDSMLYSVLMVVASPLTGILGSVYSITVVCGVLGGILLVSTVVFGLLFFAMILKQRRHIVK